MTTATRTPWWAPWRRCWAHHSVDSDLGVPRRLWCWLGKRHPGPHQAATGFGVYEWRDT